MTHESTFLRMGRFGIEGGIVQSRKSVVEFADYRHVDSASHACIKVASRVNQCANTYSFPEPLEIFFPSR